MDRTLDCGSSGWWFDSTRGRMRAEIPVGSMETHHEVVSVGPLSPEIESNSIVVAVSEKQLMYILVGPAINSVWVTHHEPTLEEKRQQLSLAQVMSVLYGATRESNMNEALLDFQKEKVNRALDSGKNVVFRTKKPLKNI